MALSEQQQQQLPRIVMEEDNYCEIEGSDYSDDSQDDPTYDIFEETRSCFSNLSMEKNTESRVQKEMDLGFVADLFGVEIATPVLDKKDEKSFEMVQKMIEDGELEKLKVDQCKVYLRKNGLRLTGTKDTLIQRIKEHIDIINGGGEKKYPVSSFVLNCKGDACTRDVVMFEQNVYQMFNIASRSASGPPCGTRIIAGRIVKESYGAAKQQHTFTIEVLWSKGEKPLPPLHPLLIKGRNLYRLKTLRQRWEDEGERRRVLMEKHSRGSIARADREVRIQEKEMLKNKRHLKDTRKAKPKKNDSQLNPAKLSVDSEKLVQPPKQQKQNSYHNQQYPPLPRKNLCPSICKENIGVSQNMLKFSQEIQHSNHVHQSLVSSHRKAEPRNNESQLNPTQQKQSRYQDQPYPPLPRQKFFPNICKENIGFPENMLKFPEKIRHSNQYVHPRLVSSPKRDPFFADNHSHREPLRSTNRFPPMAPSWRHHHPPLSSSWGHSHKQVLCRHYARGRCNFGENCKFLHDFEIGRCDSRS